MLDFIARVIGGALYIFVTVAVMCAVFGVIQAVYLYKMDDKDYGKCDACFFKHHKIIQNKHGQYTCKYCGKTKLSLDLEAKK